MSDFNQDAIDRNFDFRFNASIHHNVIEVFQKFLTENRGFFTFNKGTLAAVEKSNIINLRLV